MPHSIYMQYAIESYVHRWPRPTRAQWPTYVGTKSLGALHQVYSRRQLLSEFPLSLLCGPLFSPRAILAVPY